MSCACQVCLGGDIQPGQACPSCHGTGRVLVFVEEGAAAGTCGRCEGRGTARKKVPFICLEKEGCQCAACAAPLVPEKETVDVLFPLTETRSVTMSCPTTVTAAEADKIHDFLVKALLEITR